MGGQRQKADLLLLEEAKTGSEKAFSSLFYYYYKYIYKDILRIVNSKIDAEDLTMEAIEKAFKNISFYYPTHTFSTWIITIAKNHVYDFLKKKRLQYDYIDNIVVKHNNTPENIMIDREQENILEKTIERLPYNYKMIIQVHCVEGLSYEDIEKHFGLNKFLAAKHLCLARKKLQKLINCA
jgi:RNA polymerase sigma factor (sigma-70 family)